MALIPSGLQIEIPLFICLVCEIGTKFDSFYNLKIHVSVFFWGLDYSYFSFFAFVVSLQNYTNELVIIGLTNSFFRPYLSFT